MGQQFDWNGRFMSVCFNLILLLRSSYGAQYLGKSLGKLGEFQHGLSGEVFAVDGRTLHIKDFTYDGQGPAAYFWAGSTKSVGNQGFRIRDENNSGDVLRRYRKEGVTLTLPEGKTLRDIKWFSVWCEEFEVNFGDVKIPRNFDFPRPQKLAALQGVHGISSDNIVVVDAQTLLVPNLSYDGEAPDAKFWTGPGPKPSPQGIRIPDENGKEVPLRRYDRKTVVLTLPGDLTIFDIGHFGIWCEAFTVDFGHIQIPQNLNIPPSLKMLGVSPQSKLNCEVLQDKLAFEVRWAVAGDSIVLQLVAKLDDGEYMSFGVSGDEKHSSMVGGDVVVAWIDKDTLKGYAQDYFLQDKSQCSGPTGSCPDEKLSQMNNIRLLNAATVNGYSIVTYQRPLRASDRLDKPILINSTQPIIWAIGPLNQRNEVSFHSSYTKGDVFIDFGRPPMWNCPMPESDPVNSKRTTNTQPILQQQQIEEVRPQRNRNGDTSRRRGQRPTTPVPEEEVTTKRVQERRRGGSRSTTPKIVQATPAPASKLDAWEIPPIQCNEPDDGVFYAQMGPTGGKRGYPAITGHVGWGISWYINGLLIPVINVVRGKTYNFVVEGGLDSSIPAKYHPFYITDDPVGGYEYKTAEERQNVKIFAGVDNIDGEITPTGTGRLCHWTHQGDKDADDFESFGAYQRTLELKCDQGEPGVIQWTPDKDTPDTVYYQCFTHRYLGWKINVLDSCDVEGASSDLNPVYALPQEKMLKESEDLESSPSLVVEMRIKPNAINHDVKVVEERFGDLANPYDQIYLTPKGNKSQNITEIIPISNETTIDIEAFNLQQPKVPELYPMNDMSFIKPPPLPSPILKRRPIRPLMRSSIKNPINLMNPVINNRAIIKKSYRPPPKQVNKPQIFRQQNKIKDIHVEISPQQPSTDRAPNAVNIQDLKPAVNTGFHPESIVIEGGFRPIIRKELGEKATTQHGLELEYESSIGVIPIHLNKTNPKNSLEPMFIPSPLQTFKKNQLKMFKRKAQLKKRGPKSNDEDGNDDYIAEAAERVESFYLPPSDQKPANVEQPPETVIAFDGKRISGSSLTVKLDTSPYGAEARASKAQYKPFSGELPPLNPKFYDLNAAQLQPKAHLNRELDTPDLPASPTKLRPIREMKEMNRSKRSPHHTPEHTAEQEKMMKDNETTTMEMSNSQSILKLSSYIILFVLIIKVFVN
nr:protein Skeletor, isoforms B/C [Onthophagus taurus]